MGSLLVRRQRRMLRGWLKWVPVLLIPFGVLFTHAWLNIQILRADYVLRELDKEAKALKEEWLHAGVVQAVNQDPELLAAQASKLAFVQPMPGQREIITYDPAKLNHLSPDDGFTVAHREPVQLMPAAPPSPAPVVDKPEAPVTVPVEIATPVAVPAPVETTVETVPIQLQLDDQGDDIFMLDLESVPSPSQVPQVTEQVSAGDIDANMGRLEVL